MKKQTLVGTLSWVASRHWVLAWALAWVLVSMPACGPMPADESQAGLQGSAAQFKVMSFNVENLFDTEDSPDTDDTEYNRGGSEQWTDTIVRDKERNLANIVIGESPDILGVVEVENEQILNQWKVQFLRSAGYTFHAASPVGDNRGIRPAVISKFPILSSESHQVWKNQAPWIDPDKGFVYKTRDILEVEIQLPFPAPAHRVTVFVNHWPSRRNGNLAALQRIEAAKVLRQLVGQKLRSNPDAFVIAMGDFNDDITDRPFAAALPVVRLWDALARAPQGAMYGISYDTLGARPADRGTFYFEREHQWNTLDHILIAGTKSPIRYMEKTLKTINSKYSKNRVFPVGCGIASRKQMGDERRCIIGASDHRAITATFQSSR